MKTMMVSLCLILGGCATCRENPVACGVAFAATSIALCTSKGTNHSSPHQFTIQPVTCGSDCSK